MHRLHAREDVGRVGLFPCCLLFLLGAEAEVAVKPEAVPSGLLWPEGTHAGRCHHQGRGRHHAPSPAVS